MEILLLIGIIVWLLFRLRPKGEIGEGRARNKIKGLLGKNSEYQIFDSVILKTPDGTTQVDHILISPYGIFVIEIKNFKGWIFGGEKQKKWTQSLKRKYTLYSLFNKYTFQFQNPLHQNYKHVKAVESFFGVNPKCVFNVVVFVGDSEFKTDMPDNVMELRDFLPYIKSHTERILSDEAVQNFCKKLTDFIDGEVFTKEDHMGNLEQNAMNPICPKCSKAMMLRTARKGRSAGSEFWGCSNYPSCKITKALAY